MREISKWCESNKTVINTAKTKCMLITTKQHRKQLENQKLKITVDNNTLEQVEKEKLLGIVVDENLDWKAQVDKVYKKISSALALFRRIKQYLPFWSRQLYYNAYISPHFDFCITVWGSSCDISRLAKLQKQAARIILDCHYTTPSSQMFSRLKWMPIKDWVKYRQCNIVYKALDNQLPMYICDMFQYVSNVHQRSTRQSSNKDLYLPPRARLCAYRNSLSFAGASAWNSLPVHIREAPSASAFKSRYLNMYFN
jgi:hypothetical protein